MTDKMKVDGNAIYYSYQNGNGEKVMLSNTDVLHIPELGFDGLVGYSLIVIGKKCNRNDDSN